MKFDYIWNLKDLKKVDQTGVRVLSTFSCAGGSTMGYKMSGLDVVGCVEIDPEMMGIYRANHSPKFWYQGGVQDFRKSDIPKEFYGIDVLDGSPPCSTFSMAGNREKDWGVEKKFREGQAEQVLSDLFFEFIKLAETLRPKVVVAENVKGMLLGNAKGYTLEVVRKFKEAGYSCQVFLVNGATMGLPQSRERVFFVARRDDLKLGKIDLTFNEKPISASEAVLRVDTTDEVFKFGSEKAVNFWTRTNKGENFSRVAGGSWFGCTRVNPDRPAPTIIANCQLYHWDEPRHFTTRELAALSSFPQDFSFPTWANSVYCMGMSVPPVMMNRVSEKILQAWF